MSNDSKTETLSKTRALVSDMVMELHFRGCDDNHPLIQRAAELMPFLSSMEAGQQTSFNETESKADTEPPRKLHQMPAEEVAGFDLSNREGLDKQGLSPHSAADLVEAAFTFENELMTLLGDENAMPYDIYETMDEAKLCTVIQSAVENICRLRRG